MSDEVPAGRRFGRVERLASAIGLGTYHLTADRRVRHDEAVAIVRHAVRAGVTVVDTAPLYGLGEAELIVGEALAGSASEDLIVINKVGRFEKSIMARLGAAAYQDPHAIRAQFKHSMRLLGLRRLPLLLPHESDWAEWWDDISVPKGPVLDVLADLKRDGLVGAIGLSVRKPDIAANLCRSGLFDAMLFVHYYNMVWQEAGHDMLPAAVAQDMGIAIGAPYRQGLLTSLDPEVPEQLRAQRRESVPPGIVERIARAQRIARQAGMSMPEIGLRWLLSDRRVHTVVVGPRSVRELAENLEWAERGPLERSLRAELHTLRDVEPGRWGR